MGTENLQEGKIDLLRRPIQILEAMRISLVILKDTAEAAENDLKLKRNLPASLDHPTWLLGQDMNRIQGQNLEPLLGLPTIPLGKIRL